MAYVHSLGPAGGTILDFTTWTKWLIGPSQQVDVHDFSEFARGAGEGSYYLVDWGDEGETRALPVTLFGSIDVCRASELEIQNMLILAANASVSNGANTPVDYTEQLGGSVAEVWEVVRGVWRPSYELVHGGNAINGTLVLRVKQD
jgi:hypothetical protein